MINGTYCLPYSAFTIQRWPFWVFSHSQIEQDVCPLSINTYSTLHQNKTLYTNTNKNNKLILKRSLL